jgi:hypothetical protein
MITLKALTRSVCAVALGSIMAHATTVRELNDQELVEQSQSVVLGRCAGLRTVWEGRSLVTIATVEIAEVLKGAPAQRVDVVLPGGVDMNRRVKVAMTWPGAPTIQPGEEVFLFLSQDAAVSSGPVISGFSQGKYSVIRDSNGRAFVSRDLTKINVAGSNGLRRGANSFKSLDQFKADIRRIIAQGGGN